MRGADAAASFPWDELLALAFGPLGLSPGDFWRLTPREIALMLRPRADRGGGRPTRPTLEALMARYPDRRT